MLRSVLSTGRLEVFAAKAKVVEVRGMPRCSTAHVSLRDVRKKSVTLNRGLAMSFRNALHVSRSAAASVSSHSRNIREDRSPGRFRMVGARVRLSGNVGGPSAVFLGPTDSTDSTEPFVSQRPRDRSDRSSDEHIARYPAEQRPYRHKPKIRHENKCAEEGRVRVPDTP